MYLLAVFLAFLALCQGHAVVPVVPAVSWNVHAAPLVVAPYPLLHHGLYGHGYAKPLVHHILKRSPHLITPVAHVAPLAPVAVSHQYRHDVRSSVVPAVKPVVAAQIIPVAPFVHKAVYPVPYGHGLHYGSLYQNHY